MKNRTTDIHRNGFTLVELMVAMALAFIATIGMYRAYVSLAASCDVQEQLMEQQQNLRIAMQKMVRDIRLAGYTREAGGGFVTMEPDEIAFTVWQDASSTLKTIAYKFNTKKASDKKLDRVVNNGAALSIIQHVEALDLVYLDADRGVTADPDLIRSVQIAIVVRTTNEDYTHTDRQAYYNLQQTPILPPQNDHFHRRLLTGEVTCRNMAF